MIKRFLTLMLLAVAYCCVSSAAEKISFTRHAYDDGDYLYRTYATNPDTPYATLINPVVNGKPLTYEIILLSENVEKMYSFSVKAPESHDYCQPLRFVGDGSDYIEEILVTQYLFNDDDLYEIVFKGEDGSRWIYNEKGEFIGEIPEAANRLYKHNEQIYFYAEYDEGSRGQSVGALYSINKESNAVMTLASDESHLSASPNPAKSDEIVTITLPIEVSSDLMVKVFNTEGILLIKQDCAKGDNKIAIPAYRLATGINPVVVIDSEGNILCTGKIIRE